MRIIIAGDGKVGLALTRLLSHCLLYTSLALRLQKLFAFLVFLAGKHRRGRKEFHKKTSVKSSHAPENPSMLPAVSYTHLRGSAHFETARGFALLRPSGAARESEDHLAA